MSTYLSENGICQRSSCPYTLEQNGCAERKHKHIVEMDRSLLYHVSVPHQFWDLAFFTAVHIMNRLPIPLHNHVSPYEKLLGQSPDYSTLKIFGCVCYP